MGAEPPKPSPEPEIRPAELWFLRVLAAACALMMLWGAGRSGVIVSLIYAIPYLLGAWWLRPGTLRRGLAIVGLAGTVVGLLALISLLMSAAIPAEYFDLSPAERQVRIRALELLLLSQAALVIVAVRVYFRTGPRPPV
ncbi:MAG: hypothetical protein ACE145_02870 [Terriglobia bacterium]